VSGACLLIRRTDWDAVGGFDERFFMYTEDVDLCTSVRQRGRRVLFAPDAEVRHLRGRSAARNPDTERLRRRSQVAFYEKHLPQWVGLLRFYLRVTGRGAHG
jgi:GT2 family glycosyltransferase